MYNPSSDRAGMNMVLSAVAPTAEYTSLWLSNSTAQPVHADSLPVSLDADLMLAVSIICIGICFIAVWEFFKWCLQGVISRREAGTAVSSLSPRKARKLQRLRDQTAQAIQAEISAREEAASSQSVAAAPRRRPSQAGGAPTRYFARPEGTKLHRTKTCSTLAHSHRFVEFQVCQQCHGSAADHTQHSKG